MSLVRKIFIFFQSAYVMLPKLIPGYIGKKFRAESSEKLIVIDKLNTQFGKLKFYCIGSLPLWRSRTLFTKEPETILWLDAMKKDEILWDIGSNVGIYSIYAGNKGVKVFAFEPSALNTFLILKNIEINNLKNNVSLFPVALSNKNEFGYLNMTSTDIGGSFNEFNKSDIKTVGGIGYKEKVISKQGMFAISIDELIENYNFEIPNFIKIDVDSIEDKIIYGASKTLENIKLKSLLIELDETEKRTMDLINYLANKGLFLKEKKHSTMQLNSRFKSVFNYIFERKYNSKLD